MRNKKKVDYICLKKGKNDKRFFFKRHLSISESTLGKFHGLTVERNSECLREEKALKIDELIRAIGKYDYTNAVVWADNHMADYFEISDVLFQARKQEFLDNIVFVIESFAKKDFGNEKDQKTIGENATVIIDSINWGTRELFLILTAVKNYYREINIIIRGNGNYGIERIKEIMYDEWGVVLNVYGEGDELKKAQSVAIFLVKEFNESVKNAVQWHRAYLVSERENDNNKRILRKNVKDKEVYSGLVYKTDKILPYYLMVNMAWQKPLLFKNFNVSIVDIYAFE